MPFFSFWHFLPTIKLISRTSFKSWDPFLYARDILLVLEREEQHGRDYLEDEEIGYPLRRSCGGGFEVVVLVMTKREGGEARGIGSRCRLLSSW